MSAQDCMNETQWRGVMHTSQVKSTQPLSEPRVDEVAKSIAKHGIRHPLEFQAGELANGNHRIAAARQIGLDKVPVVGEGRKPEGLVYSHRISELEFETLAGYSQEGK